MCTVQEAARRLLYWQRQAVAFEDEVTSSDTRRSLYVGLDLSSASPAWSCLVPARGTVLGSVLYWGHLPQSQKQCGRHTTTDVTLPVGTDGTVVVVSARCSGKHTTWPRPSMSSLSVCERMVAYDLILDGLKDFLFRHVRVQAGDKVNVAVEHYAYSKLAQQGGSTSVEVGALVRHQLVKWSRRHGFDLQLHEVPATQWKAHVADHGQASKQLVQAVWHQLVGSSGVFKLRSVVGTGSSAALKSANAHPYEDLVDATGVMLWLFQTTWSVRERCPWPPAAILPATTGGKRSCSNQLSSSKPKRKKRRRQRMATVLDALPVPAAPDVSSLGVPSAVDRRALT